jgi:hypothetical protein
MTWYAARIAMQCLVGEADPGPWTVDEQIRVVQAATHDEAYDKAVRLGQQAEHDYLNPYGQKVRWVFLGVSDLDEILAERIEDGTEITYLWHKTHDLSPFTKDRSETALFWQEQHKHERVCDLLRDAEESTEEDPDLA